MDFWIYLLNVNVAISIFYFLYRMLCRKDTFFQWKRIFFINLLLISLADRAVIASGLDSEHYQIHLLRLCHHKAAAKLYNNFNVTPLKTKLP